MILLILLLTRSRLTSFLAPLTFNLFSFLNLTDIFKSRWKIHGIFALPELVYLILDTVETGLFLVSCLGLIIVIFENLMIILLGILAIPWLTITILIAHSFWISLLRVLLIRVIITRQTYILELIKLRLIMQRFKTLLLIFLLRPWRFSFLILPLLNLPILNLSLIKIRIPPTITKPIRLILFRVVTISIHANKII